MIRMLLLFCMLTAFHTNAEVIDVGCTYPIYRCIEAPPEMGGQRCYWMTAPGNVYKLNLAQSDGAASAQIWEGNVEGTTEQQYPFTLHFYRRQSDDKNYDYLTIETNFRGVALSSMGMEIARLKYLDKETKIGLAINCEILPNSAED